MSEISFAWSIEHTDRINNRGQKMARVLEVCNSPDYDDKEFFIPSYRAEAFIRARRAAIDRIMKKAGAIHILQ